MVKKMKRIPYEQALKLWQRRMSLINAQQLLARAQAQIEREKQWLTDAHDFADIPLDADKLNIKLEKGPDKRGMIAVEWEVPDDAAS